MASAALNAAIEQAKRRAITNGGNHDMADLAALGVRLQFLRNPDETLTNVQLQQQVQSMFAAAMQAQQDHGVQSRGVFSLGEEDKITNLINDGYPIVQIARFVSGIHPEKQYVTYREGPTKNIRIFNLDKMIYGAVEAPDFHTDQTGWVDVQSKVHHGKELQIRVYHNRNSPRLAIRTKDEEYGSIFEELSNQHVFDNELLLDAKRQRTESKLLETVTAPVKMNIKKVHDVLKAKHTNPTIKDILHSIRLFAVNNLHFMAKGPLVYRPGAVATEVKAVLAKVKGAAMKSLERFSDSSVPDACLLLADTLSQEIREVFYLATDKIPDKKMLRYLPESFLESRRSEENPKKITLPDNTEVPVFKKEIKEYGSFWSDIGKGLETVGKGIGKVVTDETFQDVTKFVVDTSAPLITAGGAAALGPAGGVAAGIGTSILSEALDYKSRKFGGFYASPSDVADHMRDAPDSEVSLPQSAGDGIMDLVEHVALQKDKPWCTICASSQAAHIVSCLEGAKKHSFHEVFCGVKAEMDNIEQITRDGGVSIWYPAHTAVNFLNRNDESAVYDYKSIGCDPDMIKYAISNRVPVIAGLDLDNNISHGSDLSPIPQLRGGGFKHCVLIVAYDDSDHTFTMLNSWGKEWGTRGYFFNRQDYSGIEEAWIIFKAGSIDLSPSKYGLAIPPVVSGEDIDVTLC